MAPPRSYYWCQIDYILQLVKPVIQNLASSFEVTNLANDKFNKAIQTKLSTSIWSNCASWYRHDYTGKIITQWPGTATEYWWQMRTPVWSHYKAIGASKWILRQRVASFVRGAGVVSLAFALLWVQRNKDVAFNLFAHVIDQVYSLVFSTSTLCLRSLSSFKQISARLSHFSSIPWPLA